MDIGPLPLGQHALAVVEHDDRGLVAPARARRLEGLVETARTGPRCTCPCGRQAGGPGCRARRGRPGSAPGSRKPPGRSGRCGRASGRARRPAWSCPGRRCRASRPRARGAAAAPAPAARGCVPGMRAVAARADRPGSSRRFFASSCWTCLGRDPGDELRVLLFLVEHGHEPVLEPQLADCPASCPAGCRRTAPAGRRASLGRLARRGPARRRTPARSGGPSPPARCGSWPPPRSRPLRAAARPPRPWGPPSATAVWQASRKIERNAVLADQTGEADGVDEVQPSAPPAVPRRWDLRSKARPGRAAGHRRRGRRSGRRRRAARRRRYSEGLFERAVGGWLEDGEAGEVSEVFHRFDQWSGADCGGRYSRCDFP